MISHSKLNFFYYDDHVHQNVTTQDKNYIHASHVPD